VLVFSAVSGAGYLSVVLDRAIPQARPEARAEQPRAVQYFSGLDRDGRQSYMKEISPEAETFGDRLGALLDNTWEAIRPHGWSLGVAVLAGAVVGILLVWLIAKVVIALAYALVGTATIFLGAQAALLGAGVPIVSDLQPQRWLLPIAFVTVTVIGWVWQLFYGGARRPRKEPPPEP
jgi:VIT1/CCC1 family predicted Fe2+/Mn2+ transporter